MAMGAADVVPGVSGGTVAFISGIYEELLESIKSVDAEAFSLLFHLKLKSFYNKINGGFLLVLLAGILTAIVTLAKLVLYLLENHPVIIWSFFFGLIVASAILVARQVKHWGWPAVVALLAGTLLAYWVSGIQGTASGTVGLPYLFLCGAVAICAMILPGVSGSLILLLMGAYQAVMEAVKGCIDTLVAGDLSAFSGHFLRVAVFALGCLAGLASFSRLLSWLFKKHPNPLTAALIGFLIGSLNKVWPWKAEVASLTDKHKVYLNTGPSGFVEATGQPALLGWALMAAVLGFALVLVLERFAAGSGNNKGVAVEAEAARP